MRSRYLRLLVVIVVGIGVALAMDLAGVTSLMARTVFLGVFVSCIGAALRQRPSGPQHRP